MPWGVGKLMVLSRVGMIPWCRRDIRKVRRLSQGVRRAKGDNYRRGERRPDDASAHLAMVGN
jgi:hypothetical protein